MKQDDDKVRDLYRQSASEQPPAHVDAAILAASRKAVSANPRSIAPFSGRWQLPAALAAVVMVAVLLIPLLQQESRDTEVPVPSAEAPRDTTVSPPPALMRQNVAEPKKQKARLQEDAAPARREPEKPEAVLEEEALSIGRARSAAVAEAPDQWLKRIEALVEKGREQGAVTELREFILQYPEYPLPSTLEALRERDK